jgi:hypothetical protein
MKAIPMGEYAEYEIDRFIEGFERRAEQKQQLKKYECSVCGKKLRTLQGHADHVRDAHYKKSSSEPG